ncbi:MAG: T9SS type A sorting domain-containing protein [Ignavibacteriales bacterium]|nr:T9SS type A sorting domain-containing protein [Ignavibacteriales bacterium]
MKKNFSVTNYLIIFFSILSLTHAQVPTRTGWWKFDDAANITKAELGNALELVGVQEAVTGPSAENGATHIGVGSHYKMTHGIIPSPDTLVNEYTLQIDIRITQISSWHALFQTSAANSNDGDCFINPSEMIGVAATGYGSFSISPNEWYRLVVSVKNGVFYKYYLDGQLLLDGTVQAVDERFALDDILLVFADEDGEDNEIDCAELAIWNQALTSGQIKSLGGYGHELPMLDLQPADLWKFDYETNLTEAYYGSDLELVGLHSQVEGPTPTNKAVRIDAGSYYKTNHGISANGGGNFVNEYTLKFDFKVSELNKWRTFFQTDTTNASDGDCFINPDGQIGTATTGYGGYKILANEWYRLVISVKNGTHYRYYLDGQLLLDATAQSIDGRFALANTLILFGDNDGDDGVIDIAEAAIWDKAVSETEAAQLGGFGHNLTNGGSVEKKLVGRWTFDNPFNLLVSDGNGQPLTLEGSDEPMDGPTTTNYATRVGIGSYYTMNHGITANGGGFLVNEYTLLFDFRVPSIDNWHSFFQTNTGNVNDGDCFINTSGKVGVQATGYTEYAIIPNEWYRMVVSVLNGSQYLIYLDGNLALSGTVQQIDGRFALGSELLIFADENGEDDAIDCAELAIYNYALTSDEVAALGGYGHIISDVEESTGKLPSEFSLSQNYPNPFNPSTTINYSLPKASHVTIKLYDILGNEVAVIENEFKNAGYYKVSFDGSKLASGVYIYRMISNNYSSSKKLILLK